MTPLDPTIPSDVPDGSELDAHLLALRERLRLAREERGGCPTWAELRADYVPGGGQRPGRAERRAHVALCPYCSTHVAEWRKSEDFASDRLEAIERGVVKSLVSGAAGLFRTIGRALPARSSDGSEPRVRRERSARIEQRALSAREERALAEAGTEARSRAQGLPSPAVAPRVPGLARMLVVEMADGRTPPESIFLCARVLEAEVAQVDSIDELVGDPDLGLVCGVVLGGARPAASWPDAVRHARALVKGRPVVLLASSGAEATPGARRALGDALLEEADPAERILLALDSSLR